ncbi:MAG: DUF4438 domain-containing protein [Candidatus Zixiibacteriota bacterium]
MIKTNKKNLVKMAISGKVSPPERSARFGVDSDGKPFFVPGTGGICYNVIVGDRAFGWAGDHVEPGVSTRATKKSRDGQNAAYNFLACIGNEAKLVSGDAKGELGRVTGHHGGSERVMVDFGEETMEKMTHDDSLIIKSFGQGLELSDYPEIRVSNIDPELLEKMNIEEKDGKLYIGVTHFIPAKLMGSGVGSTMVGAGDYDIMTQDKELVKELGIDKIRFGDIVAIMDHDNVYGRAYRTNAVTIGVVVHSDCKFSGHGPGVTTFLSSRDQQIKPFIDSDSNIAKLLGIGVFR